MPEDDNSPAEQQDRSGPVVAVGLLSLSPHPVPLELTAAERNRLDVARELQLIGTHAHFAEARGVFSGQPQGRVIEILGRTAAAGEQLMLAGTSLLDVRRWPATGVDPLAREVAMRALREGANYFSLSAAHGVVNSTVRLLLLDEEARTTLLQGHPGAKGFMPFSSRRAAWLAVSPSVSDTLQQVSASRSKAVRALTKALAELTADARWVALMARRDVDFHQFRPQSISGGVPPRNPWTPLPAGQASMAVGPAGAHRPPDATALAAESAAALDALTSAAEVWLEAYPEAFNDLLGDTFYVLD